MMRNLPRLLAITALPLLAAAQTGNPAGQPWPTEVQKVFGELKAECKANGGKFAPDRKRFASEIEVTNDGKPDWVIEYDAAYCSSSGNSAYCGTAGCVIEILGSGRNGLTAIFNNNVRGWEVIKDASGRNSLMLTVHGSACGGLGAEMCRQTIAWNGRKWDLITSKRGTTDAEDRAQEREAAAWVQPPSHGARWISSGKGANAVAAVTDHPSFVALGIRCKPGGGLLLRAVARPGFVLPPAGRDLILSFVGSQDEMNWDQRLRPAAKNEFEEAMPDNLRRMLAGRDSSLGLLASIDGGDEWQELEPLSLSGSSAAIRSLEMQCASSGTAQPAAAISAVAPLPPLGIAAGYYVDEGTSCTDPIEAFYYDGKRAGVIFAEGGLPPDPIGRVSKQRGEYDLPNAGVLVKVLGPTRVQLTIQDTEGPKRLCPANQIPQSIRAVVR